MERTATGILFRSERDGKLHTVLAEREVILSAGAVGSPHILLLSGVGPRDHLRQVGVPLFRDIPAVGQHMQDHLMVGVSYECKSPITFDKVLIDRYSHILKYILLKKGPFASQGLEAMAFLRTKLCSLPYPIPDLQLHFVAAGMSEKTAENTGLDYDPSTWPKYAFTILPTLLHPVSEGSITLRSTDPEIPPIIDPRYLSSDKDFELLVEGLKIARIIANQKAFDSVRGPEVIDKDIQDLDPESVEYLESVVRKRCLTVYHPTGTCRMGAAGDIATAVNPRLQVHGIEGLRVADASVMPEIVSGNTHAASVMIGEKASDIILSYWNQQEKKIATTQHLNSKI